jgi:hypothetical protein
MPDAREIHLATSQRVLRTQPFPRGEGFTQHFRLFALASAGPERQGHGFTVAALLSLAVRARGASARSCLLLGRPALHALGRGARWLRNAHHRRRRVRLAATL